LWTDKNVHEVKLYNQKYYDEVPGNYGVQSDLLKWELIYKFGGVYVDIDFECLQPLDNLHYAYDFYTGLQPMDTRYIQLGAALFASAPGHHVLKHCIETIKDDWKYHHTVIKTGPVHFTKSFYLTAGSTDLIDVALPEHYFYPLGSTQTQLNRKGWVDNGSFAVHHWAKSWVAPIFRPQEFRVLSTDEQWMSADFDEAMRTSLYPHVVHTRDVSVWQLLEKVRNLYAKNNLSKVDMKFYEVKIPKIIHQIWLNGSIPEYIQLAMHSWKKAHSDWDYKLWTKK
jgi:mannosyltransferase OCH1-like enzyme